jgi:hypothetical protein
MLNKKKVVLNIVLAFILVLMSVGMTLSALIYIDFFRSLPR